MIVAMAAVCFLTGAVMLLFALNQTLLSIEAPPLAAGVHLMIGSAQGAAGVALCALGALCVAAAGLRNRTFDLAAKAEAHARATQDRLDALEAELGKAMIRAAVELQHGRRVADLTLAQLTAAGRSGHGIGVDDALRRALAEAEEVPRRPVTYVDPRAPRA